MKLRLLLVFWFFAGLLSAQHSNNWINFNQKYVKIPVAEDGLYRITHTTLRARLLSIGVDVNTLNPRNFQLFHDGQEQRIFVAGENDNSFDPSDFIEFYGEKNKGELESELYENQALQGNPYYSLFNDTAAYFFTWNNSQTNARYTEVNSTNYASLPPETEVERELILSAGITYIEGRKDVNGKIDPEYKSGEGWHITSYSTNQFRNITLSLPDINTSSALSSELSFLVSSNSNPLHRIGVSINGQQLLDSSWSSYRTFIKRYNLPNNTFQNGNNTLRFESLPSSSASDLQSVGYVKLRYRTNLNWSFQSEMLFDVPQRSIPSRISIPNFSTQSVTAAYDLANGYRILVAKPSAGLELVVPAGLNRKIYLAADSEIRLVNELSLVNLNGEFIDYSNQAVQNALVLITHERLLSAAGNYANFKQSAAGGNHNVVLVNIENLYNQFGYGVRKSPQAIRNFLDFAYHNFPTPPAHVFLMGKSVSSQLCRKNSINYRDNLVPTYGLPSCDLLLAKGLGNIPREISIPVGRLIALSNNDIEIYLNKVRQFEAQKSLPYTVENKGWMKEVLHFAGGTSVFEQRLLEANLNTYERIIEDSSNLFGGRVTLFSKSSSAPVQGGVSQLMRDKIDAGVSIMNFFGHSSGSGFDISIDNVASYDNDGKYPLVVANSCFIGDLHSPDDSILTKNEEFLLTPNKGAIGFLASVSPGYPTQLNQYTIVFIRRLANDNYGESIGTVMKGTIDEVSNYAGNISQVLQNTIYEMSLHGDPSLALYPHEKPEFSIAAEQSFFAPENPSTDLDSFELAIPITNIGRATNENIPLRITRNFPSGTDSTYFIELAALTFKDTVYVPFAVHPQIGVGLNQFSISVDPNISIDEFDNFSNNEIALELLITSDELVPVYPSNYAIYGNENARLHASTANVLAEERNYLFQLDTASSFSSLFLKNLQQTSSGGILSFDMDLSQLPDSTVVFWRTAPFNADSSLENQKWRESSFRFIRNQSGWSQAKFEQLNDNTLEFLNANASSKRFEFIPNTRNFYARTVGNPPPDQSIYNQHITSLDGEQLDFSICAAVPSIYVTVLDSVTLEPWFTRFTTSDGTVLNPTNFWNNYNDQGFCGGRTPRPYPRFIFRLNHPAEVAGLIDMLENGVPDGNHIILHTVMRGLFQDNSIWTPQRIAFMQNLGAVNLPSLSDSIPYIFYVQKGNPSSAIETIGSSNFQILDFNVSLQNNADFGKMNSQIAGPAQTWNRFTYRMQTQANSQGDEFELTLKGIAENGTIVSLDTFSNVAASVDISQYSATDYPYLFIESSFRDAANQTAPQVKEWSFYYRPYPEYAIDPTSSFYFYADTLAEGEQAVLATAYRNLSEIDGQEIQLNYRLRTQNRQLIELENSKSIQLRAGEQIIDSLFVESNQRVGRNQIQVEINPRDSLWKPEQFSFNNQLIKSFTVEADNLNPLLEVTFDGIRILDGDIVSPVAMIEVSVKDDNPFLAIADTSSISLWLESPSGNRTRLLYSSANTANSLEFIPASLPENKATVRFQGNFEEDGVYKLMAQAQDASGNRSGAEMYSVSFEVINRSTITQVVNYPNPFTTSTRFVFTLTGSELPDYFRIQIMTISGKVVREIDLSELGPLSIGRNITQFAWDGTDEFGDRLANGVYLYRVSAKINGESIELRSTDADAYFRKGFGKMYLFR